MILCWAGNRSKIVIILFGIMFLLLCISGIMGGCVLQAQPQLVWQMVDSSKTEIKNGEGCQVYLLQLTETCQPQNQMFAVQIEESLPVAVVSFKMNLRAFWMSLRVCLLLERVITTPLSCKKAWILSTSSHIAIVLCKRMLLKRW